MNRETRVTVRLTSAEVAKLDEFRGVASRSVFLRRLLADVTPEAASDVLSHDEVLILLGEMARAGKVAAAIALERALRDRAPGDVVPEWLRD